MERHGRKESCYRMIGVPGHTAISSEGQQNLRSKFADSQREFIDHAVQFLAMQLPIRIVEDDCFKHSQDFARCGKLCTTNFREISIRSCEPTMARRLARCEADNAGLNPAIAAKGKRSAEVAGFIVRMCRDGH